MPTFATPNRPYVIRRLAESDLPEWRALLEVCHGPLGDPPAGQTEAEFLCIDQSRGLFVEGRLAGGVRILPLPMLFGTRPVKGFGVGMVSVHPDFRRQGWYATLNADMLRVTKQAGYALSALYPFRYSFYERLGWAHVTDAVAYDVVFADLPPPETGPNLAGGSARTVSHCLLGELPVIEDGAIPVLDALYRRYAAAYNGMAERDAERWRGVLRATTWGQEPFKYSAIWSDERGEPGGYVIWTLPYFGQERETGIRLREFVALTDQSYRGLLAFVARLAPQAPHLRVRFPVADPFHLYLPNPYGKRDLQAGNMLRVVDVKSSLEGAAETAAAGEGALTLKVDDPIAAWNAGPWRLEAAAGKVKVRPAKDPADTAPAELVELGVGTLAQIVAGRLKASRAAWAGKLKTADGQALELLDRLYGTRPPYLSDFF